MSRSSLRIDILGTSFSIAADEDRDYLNKLLSRYRQVVEQVKSSTGMTDPLKISIISGIVLCDEMEKERTGYGEAANAEEMTLDLIARIDEVLRQTEHP